MKVTVLWIDDEESYVQDIARYIKSLDSDFFKLINTEITKIKIIYRDTLELAYDVISGDSDNIKLIIWDIKLRNNIDGHEEYEKICYNGTNIPAMVVSGRIDNALKKDIKNKGIKVIINKSTTINVADKIAREICRIIDSPVERNYFIKTLAKKYGLCKNTVTIDGETKTIDCWIKILEEGKINTEEEKIIREKISDEIKMKFRIDEDHNLGFTRQN